MKVLPETATKEISVQEQSNQNLYGAETDDLTQQSEREDVVKVPEMINTTMASTPAIRPLNNFKEPMFDAMTPIEEGNAESK